ncbi:MAG: hypothetical protein IPP46_14745 [Bacteroidetes bacterium]|nr:hypothetical protein [Bacteroidota bacterium]
MNKLRFFTIATMVLLAVNIFLLWKMSGNGVPPRDRPRKAVIERLGLDEEQIKKYDVLIQQHRAMVKQYNGEFRQLKNALYGTLSSAEGKINTDSLVLLMGMKQQEIEKLHYSHFQEIHALCTPEQEEKFHSLTQDIAAIFAPPHADKEKK